MVQKSTDEYTYTLIYSIFLFSIFAVDCEIGLWTQWTTCQVTCGGSKESRTRGEAVVAQHGGDSCAEDKMEERDCAESACPGML